jgi:hypothetical protein
MLMANAMKVLLTSVGVTHTFRTGNSHVEFYTLLSLLSKFNFVLEIDIKLYVEMVMHNHSSF